MDDSCLRLSVAQRSAVSISSVSSGEVFMRMEALIRPATSADIERMVWLLSQLFSIEADFIFDEAKQRQGLSLMFTEPELRAILVAEVQGKVVGMCSVQTVVSTAEGGRSAWIEDVVIEDRYQGLGIGRQLLNAVEQWC